MKINGIGIVKKGDAMKILTAEGRKAVESGEISLEELGKMYKLHLVKKNSCIGEYGDTFQKNFERIPEGIADKLSPEELGALVDAFYKCYTETEKD